MSTSVIDWLELIWKTELPSNSKYVASYLRTYMNMKRDLCWPSVGRISRETGLSEQTVRAHIKKLEAAQWLEVDRSDGGHSGTTNRYKATVPVTPATIAPLQPLDPTPATVAPLPLQPLGGNKQGNKQSNKQLLDKEIPDDLATAATAYWLKKGAAFDMEEQWMLFTSHHQAKNTNVHNYAAAWRTWYVNAVRFAANRPEKKEKVFKRLTDNSWADGF
jgi:DNA-binding transcriptional ArsR family regulator